MLPSCGLIVHVHDMTCTCTHTWRSRASLSCTPLHRVFAEPHERAMAPKKAIAKKTTKRKAVAEVPAPAKKAAAPAGGKLEVVIEACKS